MNHAEHDETIGSMLASIAAALREVSEKLDVVAARVAEEVPGFPGDDEDVPDQLRIRRLEAWAFHASQDISRLSARLDALDGGDDPAPPPTRGRSRREVREAAERAAAHEEAARPPLERRQSTRSVPDHLGDPTWPITAAPVPRATTEPQTVVAAERGRAASGDETAALAVQTSGLGDPEPQAPRARNGAREDAAPRPTVRLSTPGAAEDGSTAVSDGTLRTNRVNGVSPQVNGAHAPETPAGEVVSYAQRVSGRLPAQPDRRGVADDIAAEGVGLTANRAVPLPDSSGESSRVEDSTSSAERGAAAVERARPVSKAAEIRGTERHTISGNVTWSPNEVDPQAQRNGSGTRRNGEPYPVEQPAAREDLRHSTSDTGNAVDERVGGSENTHHGAPSDLADVRAEGHAGGREPDRAGFASREDIQVAAAREATNGAAFNGFGGGSAPAPKNGNANGIQWSFDDDVETTLPSSARNGHARNGFTTDSAQRGESVFTDFTPRNAETSSAPARLVVPPPADAAPPMGEAEPSFDDSSDEVTAPGSRFDRPRGHSADETASAFGQHAPRDDDTDRYPTQANEAVDPQPTVRFTNADNEVGTRHGRPGTPAVDLPAVPTPSSVEDKLGPAPIPTDTDPAGITVTGTYRAFDLESAAHVDKLQAMLDELKRSAGLPPGRRDVFGPPTQDLG
ncbi:hypothetical protein [Nocardia caishijiensis]|uniref:Uncharacterized protein n=1 Tax=Nocardia caishijiensis TaxID=184756 RepID=A0ABQ6YP42_9NOCA|nr:hypothetical protein [Nocardia caishijiensis]KAF0847567.1 hypothetical protein FNL39_103469 [Nocardia caishijiensis]